MGFLEALTLVFIVLKLVGVVSFSWWIVFSPLLLAVAFYFLLIILFFVKESFVGRKW